MTVGVSTVASGIEKCWPILGCINHTRLWSVSIAPPWQVFCSVVWWLVHNAVWWLFHDTFPVPALDSVLVDLGQESGIIKEAAWSLLVDVRESERVVISWYHASADLSARPIGAGASGQMEISRSIWESLLLLSSSSAEVHIAVPWFGCVSASSAGRVPSGSCLRCTTVWRGPSRC